MTTTEDQKAAVLAVLDGIHAAWDNGDADAFVAEYRDDATATIPGVFMPSRQAIHGGMAFSFGGPLKGTRTSDKTLDVRFLGDDAAIVVSENGVLIPGETEAPAERTSYATWVLAKEDGKWLIAAYSNCPKVGPTPPGQ